MDAHALYNIKVIIESIAGKKEASKENRTTEQLLQDVDHYRFIAPLGSTLTIEITEA